MKAERLKVASDTFHCLWSGKESVRHPSLTNDVGGASPVAASKHFHPLSATARVDINPNHQQ